MSFTLLGVHRRYDPGKEDRQFKTIIADCEAALGLAEQRDGPTVAGL